MGSEMCIRDRIENVSVPYTEIYIKFMNLLPPKLQRRGLVFEGKMVTMERVLGYYGTCDGLL